MYDYEEFHKKYPADVHHDPGRHSKIAELCKGVVLDIGCGTGTLADFYTGPYKGFDIANSAIEKAKRIRRKDAIFEVFDIAEISKYNLIGLDTIVMSEFLEHIENDQQLFYEIKKSARPGTRLIISVPNGPRIRCDEHVREFTIPELRKKLAPFGRVRFYNYPGAVHQIVCTCDIGELERADLSLVMIVKNEEKGLEKCLLSAIDYVDEIIIAVDKLSKDKTAAIAKLYADNLKFFDWQDDFAKARNEAQIGAKGKWILFLDGHEYIKKCEGLDRKLISEKDGLMCTIEMENGFQFRNPRIFKKGLKFVGAVHEKQYCKSLEYFPKFIVQHNRVGGQNKEAVEERKQQCREMVPRIMGAQYKENKKNTRASFHLGLHYLGNSKLRKARRWFKRYLRYSECKGERWFVYFKMALAYLVEDKFFRAFWCATRADWETPGRWEIKKLKGLIYFKKGKYFKAAEEFCTSFFQNKGNVDYKPWARDDAGTFNSAGECFFRLKIYDKSYLAFKAAAERTKDAPVKKFFQDRADLMKQLTKSD